MKFVITIILIFSVSNLLCDNFPTVSLSKVSPEGGVSYSQTICIEEDSQGFIWFGTNNGLFFYNSTAIKRYSHDQNNPNSIPSNRINRIHQDSSGQLWIATENGLCRYNRKRDDFETYDLKDQNNNKTGNDVSSLFQTNDGTFWISDEHGFGTVDLDKKTVDYKSINHKKVPVRTITIDEKETVWAFDYEAGIYYRTRNSDTFQYFCDGLQGVIRSVLVDNGNIWIAYESKGLICLDSSGQLKAHFNTAHQKEFPNNQVRSLVKAEKNQIWAGTYDGIAVIQDFKVVATINEDRYSELPNHSVWSLFKDSQENIWIGTYHGGLCFHSPYNNSFSHYSKSASNSSLSSNIVSSFVKSPNGESIIVGTEDGILNYFHPKTGLVEYVPVTIDGQKVESIKSLAIDKQQTLWVGTYRNGVVYKEKLSTTFKRLENPNSTRAQIFDLLASEKGLWISEYPLGVAYYDFESKTITNYRHNPLDINSISSNNVRKLIEDRNGNIWLATDRGLNVLKKGSNVFDHYFFHKDKPSTISSDFIYTLHEDKEGYIWLGTNGQGLDKFDPNTGRAEQFTSNDGLAGNEIFSILKDKRENLWLATNNGLCVFDVETNKFQSFNSANGIQNNCFNPNACITGGHDELYFGGTNGFVQFSPNEITTNPIPPSTILTQFYINNKLIKPSDDEQILTDIISQTKRIKLNHLQNSFSFHFVANNYISPDKNRYKYRLKGFKNEWTEVDINRAIFTNIPPGNYTFEVEAANNNGVWNEVPARTMIYIASPLWKTWYAKLCYLILAIATLLYFRQQLINKHKLQNEIEREKIKRDSEDQMHQMKMQFFTNISHEFRTPLTLINGPINRILKSDGDAKLTKKQLSIIKNNTDRLLRLVNQILDFRRINLGKLEFKPTNSDIVGFTKGIYLGFEEHAANRSFNYVFKSAIPELNMDFDTDLLDKILVNIISNAFKFTPDGGEVTIELQNNLKKLDKRCSDVYVIGANIADEFVEISISDTGKGIPAEQLPHIIDRFYQVGDNTMQGTGIGLDLTKNLILLHNAQLIIKSIENEGSTFSIILPKRQITTKQGVPMLQNSQTDDLIIPEQTMDCKEKDINQEALVLIVEDNPELLDYLGEVLSEYFRIAKAQNGRIALEQTHTLFPDLIISDIMMPEMDGVTLCSTLKKDIRTSHIPILLLTALDSVKDRITALNTGADGYMPKPFDDDVLISQVNNILNTRRQLRESFGNDNKELKVKYKALNLDKMLLLHAIKVVEENLTDESFSVEDLASSLNLSRTHLHRKLKSLANQSATEFIKYVRLKNSVQLMKEGQLRLNEICYAVGFNSPNYFATCFKKVYGKSPSDFMKEDLGQYQEPKENN